MNNNYKYLLRLSIFIQIILSIWFLVSPLQGPPSWLSWQSIIFSVVIAVRYVRILVIPVSKDLSINLSIIDFFILYVTVILGFALFYETIYDECWNLKEVCEEEPFRLNSMATDETNNFIKELIKNGELPVVVQEHEKLLAAEKRARKETKLQCNAVELPGSPMPPKIICVTDMDSYQDLLKFYTQGINQKYIDKFNAIQKSVETKRRLTYVDFLYFSTVTSATVGYGDILPNSTCTKGYVIFQICINLFLTLVLFNLLLSKKNK
jgi:Ion channel